jgi:adenine-specific DNA-methyltransferase
MGGASVTELIWDGKYDAQGRRVAPLRVRLPFQTVETVNESAQERNLAFDLFAQGRDPQWRNRLIWGDKKYVLPALLDEFAGKVDLIYIDPPFATDADLSFRIEVEGEDFTKEPSIIEQKAYRDTWGRGLDGYLQWFYETAVLLRELLTENGSIYVHLDWHVGHYAKIILDEIFGMDGIFRNEITWKRSHAHGDTGQGAVHFGRVTESILFYTRNQSPQWNPQYEPYTEEMVVSQ